MAESDARKRKRVVVTGVGRCRPWRSALKIPGRASSRGTPGLDRSRCSTRRGTDALRRRSARVRSARLARQEGRQEVRAVHAVRRRRHGDGDGLERPAHRAGERDAGRRGHRQRHRRFRGDRARTQDAARARAGTRLAVLHPVVDHQPGRRVRLRSSRRERAELGGGDRLHDRRARRRRRVSPDPGAGMPTR